MPAVGVLINSVILPKSETALHLREEPFRGLNNNRDWGCVFESQPALY